MREATALTRRAELTVRRETEPIVLGFRRTGLLSVYFGQDPVFQFDVQGRLRRAFAGGLLFRSEGTTLARLQRSRTALATELVRHDLSPAELDAFRESAANRLRTLVDDLNHSRFQVTATSPEGDERLIADVAAFLERALAEGIRLSPAVRAGG